MSGQIQKTVALSVLGLMLCGCNLYNRSVKSFMSDPFDEKGKVTYVENEKLYHPSSVIVCRSKQCAPASLSMTKEYIHNSLLQLLQNNSRKKALICEADAGSHTCLENYIQLPVKIGITPGYFYVNSVDITDVTVSKGNRQINLVLNYGVSYNGQTPDCLGSNTIAFAQSTSNIIMEDAGYTCKMNAIGQTSIKTVFSIDYIDLDYGFIGGYYSIGLSGPTYGGGAGYMLIRLPKNAYPLSPELKAPSKNSIVTSQAQSILEAQTPQVPAYMGSAQNTNVQIFPINR